jgi:LysR family malonate utilization transcriptional regulator
MAIDEVITLKKLEVFLAFMRLNNLARVSELLGQSVVSVHRSLHSLEEGMRCQLFKRIGRNLIPLPAAYALTDYAQRALGEVEQGVRAARETAGFNAPRLRIGSLYSLTLRCIPQLLIGLKLRKPELDIDLTLGSNKELFQALEDGRLDAIVLGIQQDNHGDAFITVPLFDDQLHLAVPADSPYAARTRIDLLELRHEKFVRLSDGFVTAESFVQAFAKAGFTPEVAMTVGDIFSLINLVSGGIGFSLLPGRVAEYSSRIRLIALDAKYASHQSVALLMAKNRERDPNLLAVAAECRMYSTRERNVSIRPLTT